MTSLPRFGSCRVKSPTRRVQRIQRGGYICRRHATVVVRDRFAVPGSDLIAAEASPKAQPWAETAAPPASDKRPLEAVLAEFEARVAASPGARAAHPNEPPPGAAYLEKLSPAARTATGKRPKRRWQGGRKRRGGRGGRGGGGAAPA